MLARDVPLPSAAAAATLSRFTETKDRLLRSHTDRRMAKTKGHLPEDPNATPHSVAASQAVGLAAAEFTNATNAPDSDTAVLHEASEPMISHLPLTRSLHRLIILTTPDRKVTAAEQKELNKYYTTIFFNHQTYGDKPLNEIEASCIIVNLSNRREVAWYQRQKNRIAALQRAEFATVVLLCHSGETVKSERAGPYAADYITKQIPMATANRAEFESEFFTDHIPVIRSRWQRWARKLAKLAFR